MDIDKFLDSKESDMEWRKIITPESVAIILGRKGKGKSALAYWVSEYMAKTHSLLPVVINLPRERQHLLPPSYVIRELPDIPRISDAVVIIDEGTTMLPAGSKLEDMIKGFVSLSRQRNQIILFIFHSSSDVGSRILRGVDAILIKEPSQRQIQHGSKDAWFRTLLSEAKDRFEALEDLKADPREYTFVDSEEPEFRGMLQNPLPSFWTDGLSKAWAGVDTLNMAGGDIMSPTPTIDLWTAGGLKKGWHADDPNQDLLYVVTPQMEREAVVVEDHRFQRSAYTIMEHPRSRIRWIKQS
ncbi:MAG: hypothetical protein WC551_08220 [Patescibacteria group bacterium]